MWQKCAKTPEPSVRRKRVQLLIIEADAQLAAATRRAESIQTKGSFLIVAAGFLGASAFLSETDGHSWQTLLEIAASTRALFSLGAVILAVVALWPIRLDVVSPRLLKDVWIDKNATDYALEIYLLETKIKAWEQTSIRTGSRSGALKFAFLSTAAAFTAALVGTTFSAIH